MPDHPFTEHLHWIVDRRMESKSYEEEVPDGSIAFDEWAERNRRSEEEKLRKSIELAHGLGLKCDSVGWCRLDLDRPDIDAVLERIDAFRMRNGYYLRGVYNRRNADFDSEWYALDVPGRYMSGWDITKITDGNQPRDGGYRGPGHGGAVFLRSADRGVTHDKSRKRGPEDAGIHSA